MQDSGVQGYVLVSAIVFAVVAVIHLVRAISGWTFVLGPIDIPVSASWIAFVATAMLCIWGVRLSLKASGS